MDIFDIQANSRTIDIVHPVTQEPTGLKVTLLPRSDAKVEAAQRKISNRRLASRSTKVTAESLEADGLELLIAHVESWEWTGSATFQGKKIECTPENVRLVLKSASWIKEQIDREAGSSEAFFEA